MEYLVWSQSQKRWDFLCSQGPTTTRTGTKAHASFQIDGAEAIWGCGTAQCAKVLRVLHFVLTMPLLSGALVDCALHAPWPHDDSGQKKRTYHGQRSPS